MATGTSSTDAAGTTGATGAAGATSTTGTAWTAPTADERLLYEASTRGDGDQAAVLDVLSRSRLYVLVARLDADTPGFTAPLPLRRDDATGRNCVSVLTPGMLPPWHAEWVFRETTLAELARTWPGNKWWLGINLGTPYVTTVAARPAHRKEWLKAHARSGGPPRGRLLTHSGGPLHGPVAHGLALGAHLAVHNGLVWNQLGAVYQDYGTDIARLRNPWGVVHRAGFRRTLDLLLATRLVGRSPEYVLQARRTLARRLKRTPTYQEWSDSVSPPPAQCRTPGAPGSGGKGPGKGPGEEPGEAPGDWLRRIVTYEERFRADGILAADACVDTLAAFDHGRAVNVVRLALGARYCEPHEAEEAVLRIGELARQAYGSWAEFSLGYALTRVIHCAEDDDAETTYQESLAQHRILTQDPAGPYRNIPWS
ncbi:DUF1266 domain-containing protein [Streptomyces sp. NPDC088116]|uniref:DUF1266 domain-containing protein n=1 Tax=Streptomyces sp. NPDC088116 TaxID=3365825 RepID=UPI0038257667